MPCLLPYRDRRYCGSSTGPWTEEDGMRDFRAGAGGPLRGLGRVVTSCLRRLVRGIGAVLAECNYAQRRLAVLSMSVDRYLPQSNRAPDTYAEFLARTSGPLLTEPTAKRRLSGRAVR
jgi:hypothetical protein